MIVMKVGFKELKKPSSCCLGSAGNTTSPYALEECNKTLTLYTFYLNIFGQLLQISSLKRSQNNNKVSPTLF